MSVADTQRFPRRQMLRRSIEATAVSIIVPRFAFSAASDLPSRTAQCVLTPEQTVGPYYLDRRTVRHDLTEGRPGLPLQLRVAVVDVRSCALLPKAALDIWHCDASGVYSGFTAMRPDGGPGGGPPPGGPGNRAHSGPPPFPLGNPGFDHNGPSRPVDQTNFLRGVQLTGADGVAEFATIYPGWYAGRDTHIHVRVHVEGRSDGSHYSGGHIVHTGQFFFPDALTDEIAHLEPYTGRHIRRTRLDEDMVYTEDHGAGPMLSFTRVESGSLEAGLTATVTIGVDPRATPRPAPFGPGPGRPVPRFPRSSALDRNTPV